MSTITERENVLRVYRGEMPEWVPLASKCYSMGMPFAVMGGPAPGAEPRKPGDIFLNILGTPHQISPDPNTGPMPLVGDPHIKDITIWREYVDLPFPDPASLDWSACVEHAKTIDRETKAVSAMFGGASFAGSPFNAMVDMLGHEQALIAMVDEDLKPYWHELIGYLTDWEVSLAGILLDIYKPDIACTADDLACSTGPFFSLDTYREMVKPYQARIVKTMTDAGCFAEIHCCGWADAFIDDWYEIGLTAWNPAQVFNDIAGIKARYGRKFVISGGYNSSSKINTKGASEEEVRASIRKSFEDYAPGGAYIFSTSGMALAHDLGEEHMNWIADEAEKCSVMYYN